MTDLQQDSLAGGTPALAGGEPAGEFDAIVVGAGFAGLYQLYKLRELGLTTKVFEVGDGVGGTWYWNCYPGARCDVESMEYSYSFSPELEQEWEWTERYPRQPEILEYINHVADRFDLRRDIQFSTRVTAAHYDEDGGHWDVLTDDGQRWRAKFLIMATGCLSSRKLPDFPGIESFEGRWYMTSRFPRDGVDFTGKRVGVVGTGSTGIQVIPVVAEQAAHLTVFQRTPNFSVPAQNGPLSAEDQRAMKARYTEHRQAARESAFGVPVEANPKCAAEDDEAARQAEFDKRWAEGGGATVLLAYADLLVDEKANDTIADYVRSQIRATVKDPKVADLLCPTDHPLGTKRICVDTDYYATYNRDNVTLVDIRTAPIERITKTGIKTKDAEYELDIIIFAIGFDAMTGALFDIDMRGRDGLLLRQAWADGPRTYLGLAVAGFPNMFTITGPQSPSVLSNMVVSIEQHVDWITDVIAHMRDRELDTIEATEEAQDKWVEHVTEVGNATLFPRAKSWYTGANVPGKPRVFTPYVGGVGPYRQTCDEIAAKGYEGFAFQGHPVMAGGPSVGWG